MMDNSFNLDIDGSPLKPTGRVVALLGTLLVCLCVPPGAGAQSPQEEPDGGIADSVAALEEARKAQAAFERIRIAHLPWTWSRSRGPCDERIGRFCFWHDDADDWEPPPEPEPVREAREALLEDLARAARTLPGDEWIVGQRVRYLVEAERAGEARAVARASRATSGWRHALEGYALHAEGAFPRADVAFGRALDAFPEEIRRGWTDVSLLLDPPARRIYDDLGPGARAAFERRLWWLSDPLWIVPGRERRTEHLARRVLDRMQEDARSVWDVKWGHDLRELLIRYGWGIGWERIRRDAATLGRRPGTAVVGHEPPGGRRFVPPMEVLGGPTVVDPRAWSVDVDRPRSTYAPPYARHFVDLEAQVAVFRRGERATVVAAWTLDPDSLASDAAVEAGLVVSGGPDEQPAIARTRTRGPEGSLAVEVTARPAVVSVEALAPEARTAGRARAGLAVPGRASDLLVLARPEPLPRTLEEAIGAARTALRFSPGERVGLYLELYPPPGADRAEVEVRVREADGGGFWRTVGGAIGLGGERSTGGPAWSEPLDGAVVHPIAVALELPDLPQGAYAIEVRIAWPDGRRSEVLRRLELGGE